MNPRLSTRFEVKCGYRSEHRLQLISNGLWILNAENDIFKSCSARLSEFDSTPSRFGMELNPESPGRHHEGAPFVRADRPPPETGHE